MPLLIGLLLSLNFIDEKPPKVVKDGLINCGWIGGIIIGAAGITNGKIGLGGMKDIVLDKSLPFKVDICGVWIGKLVSGL